MSKTENPWQDVEQWLTYTIDDEAIAKPRMTQRDKWKKRPRVIRYRQWADVLRYTQPRIVCPSGKIFVTCYLPIPKSYSEATRRVLAGLPHGNKPDADNLLKGIIDALFSEDKHIWCKAIEKRWDDGNGARVIIRTA